MTPYAFYFDRLRPRGGHLYAVRWVSVHRQREDVLLRRFARVTDARRHAARLRAEGHHEIAIYETTVGPWTEVDP
jgi:hypothetical protein